MNEEEWTEVWPIELGHYWFYGWCWKSRSHKPEMILVEVRKTVNSIVYVGGGHYICIYKSEGAFGLWKKAIIPELPELEGYSG